jgi:phosphoribosylanthranilate isomerase
MIKIKICGLTSVETVLATARAGADFIGLVFAPSHRRVSQVKALEIVRAVKSLKPRPETVGVFVNMESEEVNSITEFCRLDKIQLSGDESWCYLRQMKKPVIKVIHISAISKIDEVLAELEEGNRQDLKQPVIPLLDTKTEGAYGGTGSSFDWRLAAEVAARFPVMIAGGLNPTNVKSLVEEVKPWGVDVSSGVETDGKKDISKIKAFIDELRRDV